MSPHPPRLLIVKTSSLGDVIHALPVASDIARALPGTQIDWLVEESFAELPTLHPAVGAVIPSALRRWRKQPLTGATWREIGNLKRRLRQPAYDRVLDLQGLIKSAWLARLAAGPRAGFDRASAREPLASLAYHQRYAVDRKQHAVTRNRQLAAAALGYSLSNLPLDYGIAGGRLARQDNAASGPRRAILLTATSRDDKLWPEGHWVQFGRWLADQGIVCVLPAGSTPERARAERIAAELPGAIVLPPSRLTALAESFVGATLAVGVDTGLTHLACALGIPTLALYTATDPGLTGVLGATFHRNLGGQAASPAVKCVIDAAVAAIEAAQHR